MKQFTLDRYTKTVLTVIAGCLLMIVGQHISFFGQAVASNSNSVQLEAVFAGGPIIKSVCLEGRLFAVAQTNVSNGTSVGIVQIFGGTQPMKCDD